MAAGDHYDVLGVSQTATADEVKRAYRSLSRLYHPDKAGPDMDEANKREHERRMIALNIAYQVLMSPRQRRAYDLTTETPIGGKAPPQSQQRHSAYATAAAARRAASWGRPPAPAPPPSGASSAGSSAPPDRTARGNSADAHTGRSAGSTAFAPGGCAPKPRYQNGGKYTQRARQARRMDPSQYTTHHDGRAAEFEGLAHDLLSGRAANPSIPTCAAPSQAAAGAPKHPTWLQKQLDRAREWEEANCPAEPEEKKYQWRKASDNWLRNIRERKSAREQLAEEGEPG